MAAPRHCSECGRKVIVFVRPSKAPGRRYHRRVSDHDLCGQCFTAHKARSLSMAGKMGRRVTE